MAARGLLPLARRAALPFALLAAALCGCAAPGDRPGAAPPGAGPAARPAGLPSLEAAAARLPAEVAEFTRGEAVWHERERPGLGVSVDYAGPARSAVATVVIYDRSRAPVPETAGDPALAQEFAGAVADVLEMAGNRTNHRLVERERMALSVPGGAPLSCAMLDGTYGRQEVRTLVCLGTAAGRWLKVQVTHPARQVRPVDPMPFVVEVVRAARG